MRSFYLCCKRNEKGQSLVEFALVLPVLALLILGIIDFGMLFHSYVTVNTAAREGARQGIVQKNNDGTNTDYLTVVNAARRVTRTLLDEEARLNIWIDESDESGELKDENKAFEAGNPGKTKNVELPSEMRVTVTYDYALITPLPAFTGIRNTWTLKGQITMVRE